MKKNELRMRTASLLSAGRLSHRYLSHGGRGGVRVGQGGDERRLGVSTQ